MDDIKYGTHYYFRHSCSHSYFGCRLSANYQKLEKKSTKDLSLGMIVQFLVGVTLWTIYGSVKKDIAILYAQVVAYIFYIPLLILKIRYK